MQIGKIKFKKLSKHKVVIFDIEGSDILNQSVLYDINHFVLACRREYFYFNINIFFRMFFNLKYIFKIFKEWPYNNSFRITFQIGYLIYFISCFDIIKPSVVITFIDNSYIFQLLSKIYNKSEFIAIQNGVRSPYDVSEWLPKYPEKKIYLKNFFCFGQYEMQLYNEFNHNVVNFFPVGSLKSDFFRSKEINLNSKCLYDICLISQWDPSIMLNGFYPEIKLAVENLNNFIVKYLSTNACSLSVALRSNNKLERDYFAEIFKDKVCYYSGRENIFSSYQLVNKSEVIIAFDSTLAREAFSWNKKVLFCNFSGHKNYSSPREGVWSIDELDYLLFEQKLNYLRLVPFQEYLTITSGYSKYLINKSEKPSFEIIRNFINNII